MNANQKATIKGIAAAAIGVIVLGIIVLIIDGNNVPELCKTLTFTGEEYCVQGDMNLRGAWILAAGFIAMVGVTVAQTKLEKEAPGQ